MARPKKRHLGTPSVSKGRERVWWKGHWHDLGLAGSDAARSEYARLAALWASDPSAANLRPDEMLVAVLCADFMASPDAPSEGEPRMRFSRAIGRLLRLHLETPVDDFGPIELRAWQKWLCDQPDKTGGRRWNRTSVASMIWVVRRIWEWGVSTERVANDRYQALLTVRGPKPGEVREPDQVPPADPEDVETTLPKLRTPPRAMVLLQLHTGARPGELCRLRPIDIHRTGKVRIPGAGLFDCDAEGVWVYVPDEHKNAHRGKVRVIQFGPAAQEILRPFLDRDPLAYCFSPAEAKAERWADGRKTRTGGGNKKKPSASPTRVAGVKYTARTYCQAVARASCAAGVASWSPYQLRHLAAEQIDDLFGPQHAQDVLGHANPQTTTRYIKAKGTLKRAAEVARKRK